MAELPSFIEGAAFGVLNDLLSAFRSNEGYAQPNRYEVLILPPAKVLLKLEKVICIVIYVTPSPVKSVKLTVAPTLVASPLVNKSSDDVEVSIEFL